MKRHCLFTTALFFLLAATVSAASVAVQPSSLVVNGGNPFSVDVQVDNVADLFSWQFDITFDPSILAATAVSEGSFLSSGGTTFFISGTIDNTAGTIAFNADSLIGAVAGVSGSGQLASIQFQAIARGISAIGLSGVSLLDSNFNDIPAVTAGGQVLVVTPEPGSASLVILLGTVVLIAFSMRGRGRSSAAAIIAMAAVGALCGISQAADITTAQMDAARTMTNPSETYLTTSNVNGSRFGKLFSRSVDGAIYAQPLYLQGMTVAGRKINIVYTATSHNNVYAFDADDPNASVPLWTTNLGQYDTPSAWDTGLGILSTPVVVRSAGALYVTAATNEGGSRVYKLHALDLITGVEKFGGPTVIAGSVTGTSEDAQNGVIAFNANYHVQRTGLALSGTNVVFAFAGDRDHAPYHGWVFSYDISTLQRTGIFSDTRNNPWYNGSGAGIWQSGRAPAVDANGAVYLETGNGVFDGASDYGESFIKLQPSVNGLSLNSWFTPSNWSALNDVDYDLGSTGPTLIPGANLVFGGAKSGMVYVMSTASLGGTTAGDTNLVQSFAATSGCIIPYIDQGCPQIHGQVFWAAAPIPTLYFWGVHDVLRAYQFSNGRFNTTPSGLGTLQANYPGGVMALSSYLGVQGTGILWVITCDTPDNGFYFGPEFVGTTTLHAYDANNLTNELWNSSQNPFRDGLGTFASFTPPTAVHGKVYVPTFSNQLTVYGLLTGPVTGDVNGDSVVDCTDLAIVKASYGKSSSQAGFDLRADVNADGVVSILDLSIVSRQVPAGTVCH